MRFVMLMNAAEGALADATPEQQRAHMQPFRDYFAELQSAGKVVDMMRLMPSSMGARVTTQGGRRAVLDGPFTEAKEVLGGFCVLEVDSLEEAIELAARCPAAEGSWVELRRPFE